MRQAIKPGEQHQFKVALDEELAEGLPVLMETFHKRTYSSLFRLALGVLTLLAEVLQKGHHLAELDENGQVVQCFIFPEFEPVMQQVNTKKDLQENQ